jgi:hypothetical protein
VGAPDCDSGAPARRVAGWRKLATATVARSGAIAMLATLVTLAPAVFDSQSQAAVPSPTINGFVSTAFNPFITPADATLDAASSTFDPATAGFDSQGWDFINSFTNSTFTASIDVSGLHYSLDFVHSFGLCGGMVYAALDTFLAGNGSTTPEGVATPAAGQSGSLISGPGLTNPPVSGPIYSYIYGRQRASLENDDGSALAQMLTMMFQPSEHDRETLTRHNFGSIAASIDAGVPIPLLVVEALSPGEVSMNHQVLATGYFHRGGSDGQMVVQIYDPNFPGRYMYLNSYEPNGDPSQYPSEIETYDAAGQEPAGVHFYGFFTTPYSNVAPPWALSAPTGNLLSDAGADWISSTWNQTAQGANPAGTVETPEAESGAAAGTGVVLPPQWTTSGNFTLLPYVRRLSPAVEAFPSAAAGAAIAGGDDLFAGGPDNSASSATQIVDLGHDASLATLIDAGQQVATLSADLGGSASQPAEMVVTATFRNGAGAALSSFSVGPVSAADRDDRTELLARSAAALIPEGTRAIDVTMSASGGSASEYDTAFADNLSLTIAPRSKIHIPVTMPKPL